MHFLTDFDNQTKLLHVGYSVLGMLVSMVVLVKFKPPLQPRMIIAVILGFVLVYCLTTTGNSERVQNITSIGWFVLGLLFGIGRGEFVIEYLACRFFGAGDPKADQAALEGTAEKQLEPQMEAEKVLEPLPETSPQKNSLPIKEDFTANEKRLRGSSEGESSGKGSNSSADATLGNSVSSTDSLSIEVNEPEELPAAEKS